VATPSASPSRSGRPGQGLADDLITLAGTPDDGSDVPALLRSITQLSAAVLAAFESSGKGGAEPDPTTSSPGKFSSVLTRAVDRPHP
jgi:hypothetical protein